MTATSLDRRRILAACIASILTWETAALAQDTTPPLLVGCDFPGGNIILDRTEGDHVYLHQDPRDTSGFWFY